MAPDRVHGVVAYYYPGWHTSSWKPVDEWSLLAPGEPCFPGHAPLDSPQSGAYDDRSPDLLRTQIDIAVKWGVTAFCFFLYYGTAGYVLDQPTRTALDLAARADFQVGVTWCLRLPHQYFPIPLTDDDAPLAAPEQVSVTPTGQPYLLRDIVPPELMDTSAVTIADLMSYDREVTDGRVTMAGEETLADDLEPIFEMHAPPTIRQVVDLLGGLKTLAGQQSATLLDIERELARNGMLDVPLRQIFALFAEAASLPDPILDHLKADVIATAFRPIRHRLSASDIRALAALGARTAGSLEVLARVSVAEVRERVSDAALAGLSLRDLRVVIEGVAFDTAERTM